MASRHGLDAVYDQMQEAGLDADDQHDLLYRATLATLLRVKQKERVPPRRTTAVFDYDKLLDARLPKYGKKLDPDNPPPYPYGCDPKCETCFTKTFPARIGVTNKTAATRVMTLTTDLNEDLHALRSYLLDHADYIGYVHVSENTRGYLGSGQVAFDEFFGALAVIGYTGPVTFETFSVEDEGGAPDPFCLRSRFSRMVRMRSWMSGPNVLTTS